MRKVYTAVVRVVIDNPDGDVTATEEQIAEALQNCVSLDLKTENSENTIENDTVDSVDIEWDGIQFVYNLKENGEMDFDDNDDVVYRD